MAEFINKELAMSLPWANGKYDKENANEHFIYGLETCKEWLSNLPIVDVAEVKHSYWEEVSTYECEFHSVTDMRCHNCGHFASLVLPHKTKCTYDFCPFCGAKMDLEEKTK